MTSLILVNLNSMIYMRNLQDKRQLTYNNNLKIFVHFNENSKSNYNNYTLGVQTMMTASRTKIVVRLLTAIFCCSLIFQINNVLASSKSHKQPPYPVLIFDVQGDPLLPENFRTTNSTFPKGTQNPPSRTGFDALMASGSGQFTGGNLKRLIKELKANQGYIVDLRKECHGFLDNIPVSWFGFNNLENKDRVASTVAAMEKTLLYTLGSQRKAIVYQRNDDNGRDTFTPRNITFKEVRGEDEVVEGNTDFKYVRFYVLDHYPPDNSQVDGFVKFVKSLPDTTWLHFHCHAGKGRTTFFMALYDMIRNANQVSMEDILKRQALIGGSDLLNPSADAEWKVDLDQKKFVMLQDFYTYVKDPEGYAKRSFSDWLTKRAKASKSIFSHFGF